MRKLYSYMALSLLAFAAGCQREEIVSVEQDNDVMEVYATIEDVDDVQTRTYLSGTDVYWSSGDKIAVFYKNTLRKRFDVTPESIDSKDATFLQDEGYVQMGKNENISHNIAYYPFCDVTCAPDGSSYTLDNLTLPETQVYVAGSVGLGAFPMVAVTENTDDVNFRFKNICGVMQFQLTGFGFVKSVSVKGNRGEILSGPAVVTAGYGKEPSITMSAEGGKSVTLDCGEGGIELNETTPVSFFIVLPPVQFEGGFTITVTDTWGGRKEYSTTKKNPVGRSKGLRMPAKEYVGERPVQEGDYVDEYGKNHGQGIEIDGVVWAPVNCGYKAPTADSKGFPYGKLYQWGRKYGQGYDDNDESYPSGDDLVKGQVALREGQAEENADKFYDTPNDWCITPSMTLWNEGNEDYPIKTEYDPCPEGWRVPSWLELDELSDHYSDWTLHKGQNGRWFSGSMAYSENVARVFFPEGGLPSGCSRWGRGSGNYWSSDGDDLSRYLRFGINFVDNFLVDVHSSAYNVRCVKDEVYLPNYVDEYGVDQGKGIRINGVVWAPVNCGYKAPTSNKKGYPYGKLYQWGRKYGQGYSLDYDESEPIFLEGPVSLEVGQSKDNANVFYLSDYDWLSSSNDALWNSGTEDEPIKTEYDPCPDGWRVPTSIDCFSLTDVFYQYDALKEGIYVRGPHVGSADVPYAFFPFGGYISFGWTYDRGVAGLFWTSDAGEAQLFDQKGISGNGNLRGSAYSVRCVQE